MRMYAVHHSGGNTDIIYFSNRLAALGHVIKYVVQNDFRYDAAVLVYEPRDARLEPMRYIEYIEGNATMIRALHRRLMAEKGDHTCDVMKNPGLLFAAFQIRDVF